MCQTFPQGQTDPEAGMGHWHVLHFISEKGESESLKTSIQWKRRLENLFVLFHSFSKPELWSNPVLFQRFRRSKNKKRRIFVGSKKKISEHKPSDGQSFSPVFLLLLLLPHALLGLLGGEGHHVPALHPLHA